MNFDALETFYWVARLSSFRKAADKLFLTQPAVSQRIRHLEEQLGVTLLERRRPSVRLTSRGQQCLQHVERILEARSDLQEIVASDEHLTGMISMGVGETVAMTWLADLLLDLERAYPSIDVNISIDTTSRLWDGLRHSLYDVILVGGLALPHEYGSDLLGSAEAVWVARKGYEGNHQATPQDLAGQRVLSLHRGSFLHGVVARWFSEAGITPSRWVLSSNLSSLLTLTVKGFGLSLVPRPIVADLVRTGTLVEISPCPAIPAIDFLAAYPLSEFSQFGPAVAEIAMRRSTFYSPQTTGADDDARH